jgi:hypothetical protein
MNPFGGKVMLILFNTRWIILQHWVPPGQTFSGEYYTTVLRRDFRNAVRKKRPYIF